MLYFLDNLHQFARICKGTKVQVRQKNIEHKSPVASDVDFCWNTMVCVEQLPG